VVAILARNWLGNILTKVYPISILDKPLMTKIVLQVDFDSIAGFSRSWQIIR
jgi:hypothetical protein